MPARLGVGHTVIFNRDQISYLTKVLRLKNGAHIGLFNEKDGEWRGILQSQDKKDLYAELEGQICFPEPDTGPILAFAPIKKAPLEWMITKATELGVRAFQPLITDHTQADLARPDRLRLLMQEAAEQCERCRIPELLSTQKLEAWLNSMGTVLVAAEAGAAVNAKDWLNGGKMPKALLVGPEGGFSTSELELFQKNADVTCLNLGPRVLKAETAALSLLTFVQLTHGDFEERPGFRS